MTMKESTRAVRYAPLWDPFWEWYQHEEPRLERQFAAAQEDGSDDLYYSDEHLAVITPLELVVRAIFVPARKIDPNEEGTFDSSDELKFHPYYYNKLYKVYHVFRLWNFLNRIYSRPGKSSLKKPAEETRVGLATPWEGTIMGRFSGRCHSIMQEADWDPRTTAAKENGQTTLSGYDPESSDTDLTELESRRSEPASLERQSLDPSDDDILVTIVTPLVKVEKVNATESSDSADDVVIVDVKPVIKPESSNTLEPSDSSDDVFITDVKPLIKPEPLSTSFLGKANPGPEQCQDSTAQSTEQLIACLNERNASMENKLKLKNREIALLEELTRIRKEM